LRQRRHSNHAGTASSCCPERSAGVWRNSHSVRVCLHRPGHIQLPPPRDPTCLVRQTVAQRPRGYQLGPPRNAWASAWASAWTACGGVVSHGADSGQPNERTHRCRSRARSRPAAPNVPSQGRAPSSVGFGPVVPVCVCARLPRPGPESAAIRGSMWCRAWLGTLR
jgi:hypothetical protein